MTPVPLKRFEKRPDGHSMLRTARSVSSWAVLAFVATFAGATIHLLGGATAAAFEAGPLRFTSSSVNTPRTLHGAQLGEGDLWVSWDGVGGRSDIRGVEFRLDGQLIDQACCSVAVSAASAVTPGRTAATASRSDARLVTVTEGAHRLTATATDAGGAKVSVAADFTVLRNLPAPSPGDALVSVRDLGARGDGVHDDTTAVMAAVARAAAAGTGVLFPDGTYRITGTIDIPDALRTIELAPRAVVRQHANRSVFEKVGDVLSKEYAVTDAKRGSTVVTVADSAGLARGDWFYFGSDDLLHGGKGYRRGFLRKIVDVSGNRIAIDRPLHRTLTASPRGWEVRLAPPITLRGGAIEQHDPKSKFQPLVHLELVQSPQIVGTELRSCGAAGVKTLGTVGGVIDTFVHDCLDDESGNRYGSGRHYGYGVEASGPTRDLVVRGTATRVRHAFTTNGAYGPRSDRRLLLIGEPEDVVVSMDVWETTSSGLDTHEPGWNITFRDCRVRSAGVYKRQGSTNGNEGGFGIFIRARKTRVENCTVERSAEDGLVVAVPAPGATTWAAADGPVIQDVSILDTEGKRGAHAYQPAHARRLTVTGRHLVGVQLAAAAVGSTAAAVSIDLKGYPGSIGVVGSAYSTWTDLRTANVSKPKA